MVYSGKPSQGCQLCKIRRIKCDEGRPACSQCVRVRKQCPGYRATTLEKSTRQAKTSSESKKRTSSLDNPETTRAEELRSSNLPGYKYGRSCSRSSNESVSLSPSLPLENLATCHFIAHYVLIPRQGIANKSTSRGFLEFLLPLLKKPLPLLFKNAFDACALASLNNRVGNGNDFDKQAMGCYTKALAATSAALQDPVTIKQDTTLAAILLLGLFENISAKSLGMFAWSSHIEGAVQLVKARGAEQLKTKIGLDLFVAVRTQMIIHSLSTGKAPNLEVDWWVHDPGSSVFASRFLQLSSETGALKSEVNDLLGSKQRTTENIRIVQDSMRRCQDLDREIVLLLGSLPESYHWKTVAWEAETPKCDYSKIEVFPGRVDLYQDLWVVNMWNVMRCMRLVLASLIVRTIAWVISPADYRTSLEYASATRTCVTAIEDIIASVPYQLGWFCKHKDLSEKAQLSGFACGVDEGEKGLAGYFLLWPLTCIQGQDYLTSSQLTWVKSRLRVIGDQLGVRYGNMLSTLNVRVPSMLILRDRLQSSQQDALGTANHVQQFKNTLDSQVVPKPCPISMPMQEQHEACRSVFRRQTEELKQRAVDSSSTLDEWTVRQWLQL